MRVPKPISRLVSTVVLGCVLVLALAAAGGSGSSGSGQIVFVQNHLCQTGNDCGLGEIAVIGAHGSGLRVLTHDKVTELSPRWSPNRQQIAFLRPRQGAGSAQIWLMNADGTHQRALTRLRQVQLFGSSAIPSLDWAPNGRTIVFAAYPPDPQNNGGPQHLYLANARKGSITQLTRGSSMKTDEQDPVWSPNGRSIAFLRAPGRIMLLATATHRVHQLTYRGAPVDALGLAWSPDSRRLAFNHGGKIHVIHADGTHLRSLGRFGDDPSWSPDGRWIVFDAGGSNEGLAEIRPDGSGYHLITRLKPKWLNIQPDW